MYNPLLKQGSSINFRGKQFRINWNVSCQSKKFYAIVYDGCNQFFIGKPGTTLRARICVKKQQIRDPEYRIIKLSVHIDVWTQAINVFPF